MTDAVSFYRQVVGQTQQFLAAYQGIRVLADRIAADSALATAAATAANAGGRSDLTTGDFDRFKTATDAITTALASGSPTAQLNFNKLL